MRLFIMRHGEASFDAASDELRSLTEKGRVALQAYESVFSQLPITAVFCSPYRRTQQTLSCLPVANKPSLVAWLTPDVRPQSAIESLYQAASSFDDDAVILLVTHQPLVSKMIELLSGQSVAMSPGSLAVVDTEVIAAGLGTLLTTNHL